MNDILAIILKDTYSLTQYKHRLRILKSNLLRTFFGSESETISLSTQDSNWLKSLTENFYQKFNQKNVYEIFSGLEKMDTNLPVLIMHLAFEPDDVTLNQLGSFARKTFSSIGRSASGRNLPIILDIKVDPNLIAGTALTWKGVYKDYSLHAKIEEKRNEIAQGFKKFLR